MIKSFFQGTNIFILLLGFTFNILGTSGWASCIPTGQSCSVQQHGGKCCDGPCKPNAGSTTMGKCQASEEEDYPLTME